MKDVREFGTEKYPLRASALGLLIRCPWRAVLLFLEEAGDSGGKAADTGSAVHKAVAAWHATGDVAESIKRMGAHIQEYPLADLADAELHFRPYTRDPRNRPETVEATEKKVSMTLSPAESDTTRAPIVIHGTLDQIRNGRVWDVKTGKPEGWVMLHEHAHQLAAYALAGNYAPGGIIRTQGYRKRGGDAPEACPDGVFWEVPYNRRGCEVLLESVRSIVAHIRAGDVWLGPGAHCTYCPAGGLENCVPKLISLL